MVREANYMTGRDPAFERQRLTALAANLDPRTFSELETLGDLEGWTCADLGAGTGSIVRWLLDRVGPTGQVVGIDLTTEALAEVADPNLEIRTGDVTEMTLGEGVFDLVTARLLFEHIPSRLDLMSRVVSALKPGGWLWAYSVDYTPLHAAGSPDLVGRFNIAVREIFPFGPTAGQTDVTWGHQLVGSFEAAGLEAIHSVDTRMVYPGGSPRAGSLQRTVRQRMNQLGELTPSQSARFEDALAAFDDPGLSIHTGATVSAWGRKPG